MAQLANRQHSIWIPDVAAFVALVTLLYCLFVFDGGRKLFRDSDTGWHIRTGERILSGGGMPRTDPFSFSRPGAPWFAWEWGSDALMAMAHRADGLRGVALLFSVVIAACTWLWFRLHWAVGGDFLLACVMAAPMLSTVNLHWLARPHVFSWALMLGAMLWLERGGSPFGLQDALVAFAGTAVWANLHASFFFAPLLAILFAAGASSSRRNWFLLTAFFAMLGSLLNPYGWVLHEHLFQYLTNFELLDRVGEFQSFNFHVAGAGQILLTVALGIGGAAIALVNGKRAHFAIALLLTLVALRSARGLPLVALIALPLANGAFARAHGGSTGWLRQAAAYSSRLRDLDVTNRGWVPVLGGFVLAMVLFRSPAFASRIGFSAEEFPVAADAAVASLPGDARLFAPDKFGGYLIYRFDGQRKVFFDGRSDFYGSEFMKRYIRMVEMRPESSGDRGWREEFASWNFTHALVPANWALRGALEESGWRVLFRDDVAVLLAGPAGRRLGE